MTKHFNSYWILMIGRVTGGIATSILFSCFESWLVSEHFKRGFSGKLLKYMFTMMFSGMYVVAILAGILAQLLVDAYPMHEIDPASGFHMGGYNNPFDLSIICLLVSLILLVVLWGENHGSSSSSSSSESGLIAAMYALFTNWRILSVGIVVSAFEGSMFAFVFNWTPALDSKTLPPPHGLIFALFMMACMCGASAFTLFGSNWKPLHVLIPNLGLAMCALCAVALSISYSATYSLQICFFGFLVFEFCCGVYFPVVGTIKSEVVPEGIRATMYNLYRVPLNGVVCGILLTNLSLGTAFSLCTMLLLLSTASTLPMLCTGTSASSLKAGQK
jgi:MFS family permease